MELLGCPTSPELKFPKIPILRSGKLFWNSFFHKKLLHFWRDLIESCSQHILFFSNSNFEIQKFLPKSVTKVKNRWFPMIFDDLELAFVAISAIKCLLSSELKIWRCTTCVFFFEWKKPEFRFNFLAVAPSTNFLCR